MYKKVLKNFITVSFIIIIAFSGVRADTLYAGLRCSEYGFNPMPTTTWIGTTCKQMVKRFQKTGRTVIPCVVWITSTFDASTNNNYLTYFDNNGIKTLLQVEPYEKAVMTWIADELTTYKSHPCVIGFGIDVEWYYPEENNGLGRKVTDNDAKTWRAKVKSYNSNYLLLLKHFFPGWCPPTERSGIVFLDDSQQFPSFERFLNETNPSTKWNIGYRVWASAFNTGFSGMQYGYDDADGGPSDKIWWNKLGDPQKEIGDSCLQVGPNTKFLFWVDFTSQDPDVDWNYVTAVKLNKKPKITSASITVQNRTVSIRHKHLQNSKNATVTFYNMNGKLMLSKRFTGSSGSVVMKVADNLSNGIYLVRVESGIHIFSNRISLH